MRRLLLSALLPLLLVLSVGAARASGNDHGGGSGDREARVAGTCGHGVTSSLRLRLQGGRIEVRFRLRQTRGRGTWRVTVVHERRVSFRARKRTTRAAASFELRRKIPDYRGSDTVVVHAWGERGLGCRATATLPPAEDLERG